MNFDEATTYLAQRVKVFEDAGVVDASLDGPVLDVCSGALRAKGGPIPVLYASPFEAVTAWDSYIDSIGSDRYRWIEKPTLSKFQMTQTDIRGMQRIVEDRYCVECRVVFAD